MKWALECAVASFSAAFCCFLLTQLYFLYGLYCPMYCMYCLPCPALQAKMTPKAFIHNIHEICRADLQHIVLPEVSGCGLAWRKETKKRYALGRGLRKPAGY
jgi:hypothetical protein